MLYKHKNYAIHRVCKRTRIIRFIHFDWWLCGCLFGLISSYFFSSAECREQSLMTFRWSWPHPSLNNVKHFASSNNTHFRSAAHWRIGLKQTKNNHFFSHITDAGSSSHWILIFFFFYRGRIHFFFLYSILFYSREWSLKCVHKVVKVICVSWLRFALRMTHAQGGSSIVLIRFNIFPDEVNVIGVRLLRSLIIRLKWFPTHNLGW